MVGLEVGSIMDIVHRHDLESNSRKSGIMFLANIVYSKIISPIEVGHNDKINPDSKFLDIF